MVTGRAGSVLTDEISIMRISEQIDALDAMALNPYKHLVIPNLLAGIISLPLLNTIFVVVGVFEGISLVNNYRSQFNDILRKSSYEELVQKIKKKKGLVEEENKGDTSTS